MTLFELTFSLSAVILGLALTHMASSLYRLVLAGRQVRWALEPLMQATLVFLIVVSVWLNEWLQGRGMTTVTYGRVLLRSLNLLVLYIAAAVCLPEIGKKRAKSTCTPTMTARAESPSVRWLLGSYSSISTIGPANRHFTGAGEC